jgi:hypothetical protein
MHSSENADEPDAHGATPTTANGKSSTPRLPAAPFGYQMPHQPHTRTHALPAGKHQSPPSHPSPSTAAASPPLASAPSTHQGHVNTTALPPKAAFREKVRAQIACVTCRRNKIRCDNGGMHTLCVRCRDKGLNCWYEPNPAASVPRPAQSRGNTEGNVDVSTALVSMNC